jgi:predicted acetyltransferase
MWDEGDDTFAGSINLRWQPGTAELPPHCLGHIGYSVVPWKRRRGFATRALAGMLAEARALGLPYVDIRTDADNHASQRVIEANGGVRTDHALPSLQPGAPAGLRYHVLLR